MPSNRLDQLIDSWSPRLKRDFMLAVYTIRDDAQIDVITERLERGDVDGAIEAAGINPTKYRKFEKTYSDAYEASGDDAAKGVPAVKQPDGFQAVFQFNIRNPNAEEWLLNNSSELVTGIVEDQRTAVRNFMQAGLARGDNPRTTALDLVGRINPMTGRREGGIIGLTTQQELWVRSYQNELSNLDTASQALRRNLRDRRFDAAVQRAINSGVPLSSAAIANMVLAYRNRALRLRAETISRTETMSAVHAAQEESFRQAIEAGNIDKTAMTWIWRATKDTRTRDTHRAMNGQRVKYGQPFVSPSGAKLRYPGDALAPAAERINCRCWREPKVDFLAAAVAALGGPTPRPRRGKTANAAKLYKPATMTPDQVIAKHGAAGGISRARARIAKSKPTNSLVKDGGFKNADGTYTDDRVRLHNRILRRIFTNVALARAKPPPGVAPTLTTLGGRGGSGKSWLTGKNGPVDKTKAILLDADAIKEKLPGYKGWNATLFHEESADILARADEIASTMGVNVIHDATMKTQSSVAKRIVQYENKGYQVEGYYMYASPDTAADRALSRFSQGGTFKGRFVPPEIVYQNVNNESNFDNLSSGFKKWAVYDNDKEGGSPVLIEKGENP